MTGPPHVRLATELDLTALQEIVSLAYSKYLTRMDRPPAPMLGDVEPLVRAGEVWVTGQPIIGLICLIPQDSGLLVEDVAVHPGAQGRGVGRRLMEFAEQESARQGFARLRLYTNEVMTENVAIYAHLGYREVDRRTEDGYRRVFMEKLLSPGEA